MNGALETRWEIRQFVIKSVGVGCVIRFTLPWLMKLPGREFMTTELLLEGVFLGR